MLFLTFVVFRGARSKQSDYNLSHEWPWTGSEVSEAPDDDWTERDFVAPPPTFSKPVYHQAPRPAQSAHSTASNPKPTHCFWRRGIWTGGYAVTCSGGFRRCLCREGRGDSSGTAAVAGSPKRSGGEVSLAATWRVPTGRSTVCRTRIGDSSRGRLVRRARQSLNRNRGFGYHRCAGTAKVEILV